MSFSYTYGRFIVATVLICQAVTSWGDGNASNPHKYHAVASACGSTTANITCVYRYGTVLPPSFERDADPTIGYTGSVVPEDPSWKLVQNADFVVFDKKRGLEVLGATPKIQHKYLNVLSVIHEAPIFVPDLNLLFVTQDGPPGNLSNLKIDLNKDPPSIEAFVTVPPVYQPTGGILYDNMIYWALQGNNITLSNGVQQRPGVARVNPRTLEAEILFNNYYGFFFGGLNDLTVDPFGDIWFTDSGQFILLQTVIRLSSADAPVLDYALGLGVSNMSNQNQLASYRFRPSTGEIQIVDSSLQHPNGIVFSRDGKTLYISDTGLETVGPDASRGKENFYDYPIRIYFTSTLPRNIYAFDVRYTPSGAFLSGKRNIFQSLEGSPDGLKVAANGYIVVGSGLSNGADIIDPYGALILRIQTTHPVENVAFTGPDLRTLYLVGIGGITRVEWNLTGPDPNDYYI